MIFFKNLSSIWISKNTNLSKCLFLFLIVSSGQTFAQKKLSIRLKNSSFEGIPHDATTPKGWVACGLDSSPDILPGPWGVYQKPTNGKTYVGLITRENKTWESMGQRLPQPLKKNHCYKFKVDLSHSPTYAGYAKPTRLRVWLGKTSCSRNKLVVSSITIYHYEWKTYEFIFSTENEDYYYIIIEPYYKEPSLYYYRGNLLLDNFSIIEYCDRA